MTLVLDEAEQTADAARTVEVERSVEVTSSTKPTYVSSVLATAVVFFLGVGIPCWAAFGLGWGVGLGAMCAFWGGPGFGVMVGGARVSLKEEKEEREHPAHH